MFWERIKEGERLDIGVWYHSMGLGRQAGGEQNESQLGASVLVLFVPCLPQGEPLSSVITPPTAMMD